MGDADEAQAGQFGQCTHDIGHGTDGLHFGYTVLQGFVQRLLLE
jgi:hypothetical protein